MDPGPLEGLLMRHDIGRALAVLRTAVVSAALLSLAFVFDGPLAWLGLFGAVPILLHTVGCPSCTATCERSPTAAWPTA